MDDPIYEVYVVIRERQYGEETKIRYAEPKVFDTIRGAMQYCQEDACALLEWHKFTGHVGWRAEGINCRYSIRQCPIRSFGGDF